MLKHTLIAVVLFGLMSGGFAWAETDDLIYFDLALAGYRLGMSYEEAVEVRQFNYIEDVLDVITEKPYSIGVVKRARIHDVDMDVSVHFHGDKAQKIVLHFSPADIEKVLKGFKTYLGPGENRSKPIKTSSGDSQQAIYRWDFPMAEMYLVQLSSNVEYATVSLIQNRVMKKDDEEEGGK